MEMAYKSCMVSVMDSDQEICDTGRNVFDPIGSYSRPNMSAAEKILEMTKRARTPYVVSVVDDDQAVRDALGNLLESVGLQVEAFASAEEFVQSNRGKTKSCLILDVMLPRMSGLELQQYLSGKPGSVPIIFISAHSSDEVRCRALQKGAVSFLSKPFKSEDLLSAVHSTLL